MKFLKIASITILLASVLAMIIGFVCDQLNHFKTVVGPIMSVELTNTIGIFSLAGLFIGMVGMVVFFIYQEFKEDGSKRI